jgi:hypothetical protein
MTRLQPLVDLQPMKDGEGLHLSRGYLDRRTPKLPDRHPWTDAFVIL